MPCVTRQLRFWANTHYLRISEENLRISERILYNGKGLISKNGYDIIFLSKRVIKYGT